MVFAVLQADLILLMQKKASLTVLDSRFRMSRWRRHPVHDLAKASPTDRCFADPEGSKLNGMDRCLVGFAMLGAH
jgi:hypothetical protein